MKTYIQSNKEIIIFILKVVLIWRIILWSIPYLAQWVLVQRSGFLGPIVWANFDGMHYLSIAQSGYYQFEQAFFPLFPLLIKGVSIFTLGNYLWAAVILVHIFLIGWLFLFYKLIRLDYTDATVKWAVVFAMLFPTAFYFGSIYTETLFLFLVTATFYAGRKAKWFLAAIFISLASATKLIGIFLLPAILILFYLSHKKNLFTKKNIITMILMGMISSIGLLSYMGYLWHAYNDALYFIHAQPAFGAHRTGGTLIFLPQVMYRYIKIFLTVPFSYYDTWIALLEFISFVFACCLLIWSWYRKKIAVSYIVFSLLAIIGPTLTGTFSSMPRYILVAFPLFIFLGLIKSARLKLFLLILFAVLGILLTSYFTQGYFVA